jgi:SAM-dependent methyltransferase
VEANGNCPTVESERIHQEHLVTGDAFGEILLACEAGDGASGVAFELIERSDGHLGAMDAARYFAPAGDWTATTRFACDQADGRVLDVGAGAGRVALALQDRGHDVVALDVSAGATTVCRRRGVRATFTGTLFEYAACAPEPFDSFVMLGNNLGLLAGPEQAPLVLDALARVARRGARIVGETLNPYWTSNPDHLRYHEENRRLGRLPGQLRLRVRHLQMATPWWDYLLCTPDELDPILAPTAWQLTDTYPPASAPPEARSSPSPGQWTAVLTLRN